MDRRQQYREQTRQEAKRIALEQLAEHGVAGISVNAIGKRMGVTGPGAVPLLRQPRRAAHRADLRRLPRPGRHPRDRDRGRAHRPASSAGAAAMRDWANAAPHRYLLLFGTPIPGYEAPEHTLAAASRAMVALLSTAGADHAKPRRSTLHRQVAAWGERMGYAGLTPRQLHWGLTVWARLHGFLSLEVAGQFTLTGVDPELLFRAEVDALAGWWAADS